jgi:hypothetical protein
MGPSPEDYNLAHNKKEKTVVTIERLFVYNNNNNNNNNNKKVDS